MKRLATEYRLNGWNYRQIKREGNVALYSQGGGVAYEVFRIRQNKARDIKGSLIPAHEAVPSDSEWGKTGWTLPTLDRANEKFTEVVESERLRALKAQQSAPNPKESPSLP